MARLIESYLKFDCTLKTLVICPLCHINYLKKFESRNNRMQIKYKNIIVNCNNIFKCQKCTEKFQYISIKN